MEYKIDKSDVLKVFVLANPGYSNTSHQTYFTESSPVVVYVGKSVAHTSDLSLASVILITFIIFSVRSRIIISYLDLCSLHF